MKNKKMHTLSLTIIIMAMLAANAGSAFADDAQPEVEAPKAEEQTAPPAQPSLFEDNENTVPVDFSGKELPENWEAGGSAQLTGDGITDAEGDGWLRLTGKDYFEGGYVYSNEALDTTKGLAFKFDFASWGGSRGGDGFVFFLFDGETSTEDFNIGGTGGSLGYSPRKHQDEISEGLSNAYVGIGFDEFGNFARASEGRNGGYPRAIIDSVTVRGPGDGFEGYEHVVSSESFVEGIDRIRIQERPDQSGEGYRSATIIFTPVEMQFSLTLLLQFGANNHSEEVFSNLLLPGFVPANVKYGFSGTTGSFTNYHEIRNLVVDKALIEEVWEIIEDEELDSNPHKGKKNPVIISELPVRVVQEGDSLVLIPVTGMELHELDCASQTQLAIEKKAYALLPALCGFQGGLWLLAQEALPGTLPNGYEALKTAELMLVSEGQLVTSLGAGQSAELGFWMDDIETADGLAIFFWNPDAANGQGDWEWLESTLSDGALEAQVTMSGIYLLAKK